MVSVRSFVSGCIVALVGAGFVPAQSPQAQFHEAYYLETEKRDLEKAVAIYRQVAENESSPAELVIEARKRLAACREEIRGRDLSRLMPPEVLAYVEVHNPGMHLAQLLEVTGLTKPIPEGAPEAANQPPFVVSPKLTRGLKSFRSVAVALTGIDLHTEMPEGVVVINAGRDDLLQGLLETGLAGGALADLLHPAEPLAGHPTYTSPFGTVVTTERLVIAGTSRDLVSQSVRRIHDDDVPSLNQNADLADFGERRHQSILFAYADARRILDLVRPMVRRGDEMPEEYQVLQAVADVESLRFAALSVGTSEEGLFADIWMRLEEGNHSLAYNFLRTPPVSGTALGTVPAGVAMVAAFGLSEDKSNVAAGSRSDGLRYVTGLDIGREIFANVNDVVIFSATDAVMAAGEEVPGVGLVFMVKDPGRSTTLWNELLRVPATALREEPHPVRTEEVDGHEVRVYSFPESIVIHMAALPDRVVLSNSRQVLAQALKAASGNGSILDDEGLARATGHLTPESSKILIVHAGRVWTMVAPMMRVPGEERAMIASLLEKTTVTLISDETPTRFHARATITLPPLGELIREYSNRQRGVSSREGRR